MKDVLSPEHRSKAKATVQEIVAEFPPEKLLGESPIFLGRLDDITVLVTEWIAGTVGLPWKRKRIEPAFSQVTTFLERREPDTLTTPRHTDLLIAVFGDLKTPYGLVNDDFILQRRSAPHALVLWFYRTLEEFTKEVLGEHGNDPASTTRTREIHELVDSTILDDGFDCS